VTDRESQTAVDGGDGTASIKLSRADERLVEQAAARTTSSPDGDPMTGAELGSGEKELEPVAPAPSHSRRKR
jgi:Mn-containing catalase